MGKRQPDYIVEVLGPDVVTGKSFKRPGAARAYAEKHQRKGRIIRFTRGGKPVIFQSLLRGKK